MTDTLVARELDVLGERVQRAADALCGMAQERDRIRGERDALAAELQAFTRLLRGRDAHALVTELEALRRERRDLAGRIEALVKKLERIDA